MAPDDAEYIGVGRQLLSGSWPTRVNGGLYTIRSWVWPLLTGGASKVVPGDVFRGPKALGVALGALAIAGAVVFAYRRRGGVAAVGTAAALGLTAVVWEVAGSTRVDVALLALLVGTILVAAEPSPRRVALAGVLAGVTLLVKESSALLVLLPLAWYRRGYATAWWRAARRFWIGFALAVSWWFVLVLVTRGEVFPIEGLRQAVHRDLPRAWAPNPAALVLVAGWGLAWVILLLWSRRDVAVRVLGIATLALVPATSIAWTKELALRQFAPIAVLGAVAIGVACALVVDLITPRSRSRHTGMVQVAAAVLIAGAAFVPAVHLQRDALVLEAPALDRPAAAWVRRNTPDGGRIASSFRFEATTWARIGNDHEFRLLGFSNDQEAPPVAAQVWLDWSDGAFRSLSRRSLGLSLRSADALMLTGRHRLGPIALAIWLQTNGRSAGLPPRASYGTIGTSGWINFFGVQRPRVSDIPTLVTAAAINHLDDASVRRGRPHRGRRSTGRDRARGGADRGARGRFGPGARDPGPLTRAGSAAERGARR